MVWKVTQWFFRPTTENKVFWSPSLPLFPKVQSLPEQHLAVPSVTVLGRFTFRKSCSQKLFSDAPASLSGHRFQKNFRRLSKYCLIIKVHVLFPPLPRRLEHLTKSFLLCQYLFLFFSKSFYSEIYLGGCISCSRSQLDYNSTTSMYCQHLFFIFFAEFYYFLHPENRRPGIHPFSAIYPQHQTDSADYGQISLNRKADLPAIHWWWSQNADAVLYSSLYFRSEQSSHSDPHAVRRTPGSYSDGHIWSAFHPDDEE